MQININIWVELIQMKLLILFLMKFKNLFINKMSIHTFGDSHSYFGWRECRNIITHYIGPVLCYSFGKEKLNRCDITNFNIKDNDILIFCFGEIDCRCHVHKHITETNTYQIIIDNIVDNYTEAIKLNIDKCKINLKNICIYNVVPPVEKNNTPENSEFPYLGTDEERKKYVLYFNECIKEKCIKNNWIYFDIYEHYTDENGFLDKKLSDGIVHIRNEKFLKYFIDKYLS